MSDQKETKRKRISYSHVFKVVFIIILVLMFLIPLAMIRRMVMEREARSYDAEQEIMDMWGGRQTLAGPYIAVPFRRIVRIETEKGEKSEEVLSYFFMTPKKLDIRVDMRTEIRTRGIYDVPVYTSDIVLTGEFEEPDIGELRLEDEDIDWDEARVILELPGLRSVETGTVLSWNGKAGEFVSNVSLLGLFDGSLQYRLEKGWRDRNRNSFAVNLKLRGAGSMSFLPFGDETVVHLSSDWTAPSFNGAFLPSERDLDDETGFRASWSVHSLARSFPRVWKRVELDTFRIMESSFGVELFEPVDLYARTERSVKYGMLFIILPFIAFFMMEVFTRNRIHILQYLMVGAANTIFYLLVLSLSEHLGFNTAYVLASAATAALIIFYSAAILPGKRAGLAMAPVMTGLYVFLFTVLQSEDYALLIGSLGLFAILTLIMVLTRNINWYALNRDQAGGEV